MCRASYMPVAQAPSLSRDAVWISTCLSRQSHTVTFVPERTSCVASWEGMPRFVCFGIAPPRGTLVFHLICARINSLHCPESATTDGTPPARNGVHVNTAREKASWTRNFPSTDGWGQSEEHDTERKALSCNEVIFSGISSSSPIPYLSSYAPFFDQSLPPPPLWNRA